MVVTEIDMAALRAARERRIGHDMLHHMRTELYSRYSEPVYPGGSMNDREEHTVDDQIERIHMARRRKS